MKKHSPKPTAIDLFCGCGGLSLGLKQAGFNVVGAVDIDPLAIETYKANHTGTTVWQTDIQNLRISDVKKQLKLNRIDLVAGCPPCQGFSSMRTLNGSKRILDRRNDLIFQFLRFIRAFQPKVVMLENVPGLAEDRRIKEFSLALASREPRDPRLKALLDD